MTNQEGQNLVLVSGITVMGVETLKVVLTSHNYSSRLFIGGGIAFTILAGVAEFAPGPAGLLAATVAVTVLLTDGAPVINQVLGVAGSPPPKGKKHG